MNQVQFSREVFAAAFERTLRKLTAAEKVTKEYLKELSRTVLEATHETGDNQFVNRLLVVLTPVNKKVAILYFKAFLGYNFDEKNSVFSGKNKRVYDAAHKAYVEFMADPHNNIWTWAERNIEVEEKAFDVKNVTKLIERAIKKNVTQKDILRAVLAGGVEVDTLMDLLVEMGHAQENAAE